VGADDCLRDLHEEAQMELAVPYVGTRAVTAGEQLAAEQRARERREREIARLHVELDGGVD
jgi:hypothetical protein